MSLRVSIGCSGCWAVKLARFGYSLMDVGTGSIIFSSGVPDLVVAVACPSSRQLLFS